MKIVISPAKSLDFETKLPSRRNTQPSFLEQATVVHSAVKDKTPAQLSSLMDISDKLADLNWERNQNWATPFTAKNARPALYAFNGDVYTGLDGY
ncbi:MAG: YaaA family protein, partial [Bacteroidota bacterium]